jgi:hypothetical protein
MTRPDLLVKRVKKQEDRRKRVRTLNKSLALAADLERRAASLTFTIATLDEERARLLIQAAVLRRSGDEDES